MTSTINCRRWCLCGEQPRPFLPSPHLSFLPWLRFISRKRSHSSCCHLAYVSIKVSLYFFYRSVSLVILKEQFLLPSQKKKLRAERAAMQPQYDPNDPDAIVPVQEEMIEAAPGQQLVTTPFGPLLSENRLSFAISSRSFSRSANSLLLPTNFFLSRS